MTTERSQQNSAREWLETLFDVLAERNLKSILKQEDKRVKEEIERLVKR